MKKELQHPEKTMKYTIITANYDIKTRCEIRPMAGFSGKGAGGSSTDWTVDMGIFARYLKENNVS